MKIKDTFHGMKGEAMRLMFNMKKEPFFDQYITMELEKPNSPEEFIAVNPEAHFYEYHVTGYMSSLLYIGGQHGYIPTDPQQYYDATAFARTIEKFTDNCLLYLLKSDRPESELVGKFDQIVVEAARLLEKNRSEKFLCGTDYTIADFAFMGLFLSYQDQSIAKILNPVLTKHKTIEAYANYHRTQFLPYLIEGGRFTTCYALAPYSTLFKLLMGYKKIKTHIVESKDTRIVIAGVTYPDFTSALEMFARTLGLLKNDHIFENLYYRDIAASVLFADKTKGFTEALGEALYGLNNYYGYLRSMSPDKKWPATLADIYSAIAVESCCQIKPMADVVQDKFKEAYEFSQDFIRRYRRAKHCIILKSSPAPGSPLPPQSVELINFMNRCRRDLHDVMRNLGFETAETIYPLLTDYERVLGQILERPDYKAGDVEIFAYIDANQKSDLMLGYSGIKFLEDHGANFAGCSYDFAWDTVDKAPMKELFVKHGVATAPFAYMDKWDDGEAVKKGGVMFPVIVKLSDAYASFGMTKDSKCKDLEQLKQVVQQRLEVYNGHPLLIESFIEGPEYTVLIAGIHDKDVHVYPPIQRVFDETVPEGDRWLFFEFYWKSPIQKLFFKLVTNPELAKEIAELAKKAYASVKGNGYGRVDLRLDRRTNKLYVLEVNCMCAIGFESTSFYALRECGKRTEDLFEDIFYYGKLKCAK